MDLEKQEPVTSAVSESGSLLPADLPEALASGYWLQRNLHEQHTLDREAWTEWRVRGACARRGVLKALAAGGGRS